MAEPWSSPSPHVADLIRRAAQLVLDQPQELMAVMDQAVADASPAGIRDDLTLGAEAAASTRANMMHWASWTVGDPGSRVPVHLSPEVLGVARDVVRRGADELLLATYHAGQNIAWRYCMAAIFEMTRDPDVLREALDTCARSIFAFVDDTLEALREQMERERSALTGGTHAERFEVVSLILEGAPVPAARASQRLGYALDQRHTAAVLWSDPTLADHGELLRAAEVLARAAGAVRPLTVVASASALWAWWVGDDGRLDADAARAALAVVPGVRAAIGPAAEGIDGFRRSHLDAVAAQRLMMRMPADLRVATFADVQLVALTAGDSERSAEFVARTLGELATADPELRQTLRAYIREGFSASRAARVLFAHRNTVLNRLARAERLLPAPLEHRGVEVGLALEIVHWLGAPAERA